MAKTRLACLQAAEFDDDEMTIETDWTIASRKSSQEPLNVDGLSAAQMVNFS